MSVCTHILSNILFTNHPITDAVVQLVLAVLLSEDACGHSGGDNTDVYCCCLLLLLVTLTKR
jgi:hypothetical protein